MSARGVGVAMAIVRRRKCIEVVGLLISFDAAIGQCLSTRKQRIVQYIQLKTSQLNKGRFETETVLHHKEQINVN